MFLAKVMISVHCATMLTPAKALKVFVVVRVCVCCLSVFYMIYIFAQKYLIEKGYTVFLCDQIIVGDNFRREICLYVDTSLAGFLFYVSISSST